MDPLNLPLVDHIEIGPIKIERNINEDYDSNEEMEAQSKRTQIKPDLSKKYMWPIETENDISEDSDSNEDIERLIKKTRIEQDLSKSELASSSEFEDGNTNMNRIAKLEEQFNDIKGTLSRMEKRQVEILRILKEFTNDDMPLAANIFPITQMQDLQKVDKLVSDNKENYVRILKRIIKGNIGKNFDCIIGKGIIPNLNFDGLNGKEPFKQFKALNDALFHAIKTEGCTTKTYATTIRNCFRLQKGRLAKQKFDSKPKKLK